MIVVLPNQTRAGHAGQITARPQPHGDAATGFFPALMVAGDRITSARVKFRQEPSRRHSKCLGAFRVWSVAHDEQHGPKGFHSDGSTGARPGKSTARERNAC